MKAPWLALWLFTSHSAFADWVTDSASGCQVEVHHSDANTRATWKGLCRDGKAEGAGTLTASNGSMLTGEFRAGKPFRASGHELMVRNNGWREAVSVKYTDGTAMVSPLVKLQNRHRVTMGHLAGNWAWRLLSGKCDETHEYQASFASTIASNEEVIERLVQLYSVDRRLDLFEMNSTSIASNGKPDCRGEISDVGRTSSSYILFKNRDTFLHCSGLDEASCFASAVRIGGPLLEYRGMDPFFSEVITTSPGKATASRNPFEGETVFERNKAAIYALYSRTLRDQPQLRGAVQLSITIAASGEVTQCAIEKSEIEDAAFLAKLVARVKRFEFERLREGIAPLTVTKSIDFQPAK